MKAIRIYASDEMLAGNAYVAGSSPCWRCGFCWEKRIRNGKNEKFASDTGKPQ